MVNIKEKKNQSGIKLLWGTGSSLIKDLVQGDRNVSNSTIEDFVILRKDKYSYLSIIRWNATKSMNITHVIRGDDHMINSFKQKQI